MAHATALVTFMLVSVAADGAVTAHESQVNGNPIRKTVTLLQNMQKKVTAEGEKEKELFEKFMCYCKNGAGALEQSISDAENKIPQVSSSINEAIAQKAQLDTDVKQAQTDRQEAKQAIAKATAIREKEASVYAKESSDYETNIKALQGAIAAISKGMGGGFLQTNTAAVVRRIAMNMDNGPSLSDEDRQDLIAFLSGSQANGYNPRSGEIVGILKEMEDEMSKSLADITAEEKSDKESYEQLMTAKTKEIASLTKAIESKSKRSGDLGVEIAMMQNDLSDTMEALSQDKKFFADLKENCDNKEREWDQISKIRADELVAIADTIKILNDDDALEIFKKTLPSASVFAQVKVTAKSMRKQALKIIRDERAQHPSEKLGFMEMALQGKGIGFEKVIKMIDDMVAVLKKEQKDDDSKKDYCSQQLDETEDKKKELDQSIKDLSSAIADAEEGIATLKSDIASLGQGIKDLDKSVADATEQRQQENTDYEELVASDTQAKEILQWAKNRLNKFYNPKLYNPPPKRTLEFLSTRTASEFSFPQIPLSFAQVSRHSRSDSFADPGPAPEAPGPFKKKTEESNGVIAMIDLLIKDLDKEVTEAGVEEKDAQKEYESMMADAKAKRAEDSKMITAKESNKAQLEGELQSSKEGKAAATKELMATLEYMTSLHADCDWLLKNFQVRKEARASEVEALGKAKAVLSGADYSAVL